MLEIQREKQYRAIPPHPYQRPPGTDYNASQKQVRRSNRYMRYEAVRTLYQQGVSIRAISRQLDLCRETVRTFVRAEAFPELCQPVREKKRSILDSYKPYLLQRWQQGCWNGAQLYDEIKARGYIGSGPLLRIFLKDLRKKHRETGNPTVLILDPSETKLEIPLGLPPKPHVKLPMSPTRASWLCISQSSVLDEKQQQQVEQIREGHADLEAAYQLSQAFVTMLAERRDKDLDTWLSQAEQSGFPEFQRLAHGMRRDYSAVRAAFSSPISNGQVEGQVHRLKLQKRQVYGRANFDLLRLRVLSHS